MGKRSESAFLLFLLCFSILFGAGLLVLSAYSWTPLEGHITENTTLTLAESPYRVINDVTVDAGVKLTIDPGVKVEFADGFSLIVNGTLHAVGTPDKPINLTSSRPDPSPGVWNTIKFAGGKAESFTMKHCVVTYAKNGIISATKNGYACIEKSQIRYNSESGVMLIEENNVKIAENMIEYNKNGIAISLSNIVSGIAVADNTISSNQQNGICLYSGYTLGGYVHNVTIVSNTIVSNGASGICIAVRCISGGYVYDVTISSNMISSNGEAGIYINNRGDGAFDHGDISNVSISSNTISSNGEDGICLSSSGDYSYIYGIMVSDNTLLSNAGSGVSIDSNNDLVGDREFGKIYYISILRNKLSSNNGDGVHLHCSRGSIYNSTISSNVFVSNSNGLSLQSYIYVRNVTISSNTFFRNYASGIAISADQHQANSAYDLLMRNNTISANFQKGIAIEGGVNANITNNSLSYNNYGVLYIVSKDNWAKYNDIYRNTYGMNVTAGATVNAEYNYWGDASGPYHVSINWEGKGNPVNGDGTDLDFIQFSTVPFNPIIELQSLVVSVSINSTSVKSGGNVLANINVTNGTVVVSDVSIQLASDKGGSFSFASGKTDSKGDFKSTFNAPSVSQQASVKISATASKLGYVDGADYEYVTVYPPGTLFLSVTVTANPSEVQSSRTSTITVRVTDGTNSVSDATVALSSNKGGSLSPTSGETNTNGDFTATYTAPSVTTQTAITITANATKTGYISGQNDTQITVSLSQSQSDLTPWMYLAIFAVILLAIGGVAAIARRKSRQPKQESATASQQ